MNKSNGSKYNLSDEVLDSLYIVEKCSIDAGNMLPVPLSCDVAISDCWYGEEYTFDKNHNLIKL